MRFGKKSRNLAAAGRRLFGERPQQDRQAAGLAVQTLEPIVDEENTMTPPSPEEPRVAGDPTQRLLTALGRFQRQVTRAEEGAPQEAWCDECMNQLITGIEIALGEDWDDVKEALTDTARILQTYEDAGQAGQCVGFLKESYEILCLMVGDLIVGNVRSGVMKKWENRYERALDDLAAAGLTLIDDEGPVERETAHAPAPPDPDDFDRLLDDGADVPGSVFDDAPAPAATARAFASDPGDPFAPVDLGEDDAEGDSPFDIPAHNNRSQEEHHPAPSLDELLGRPVSPGDDLEDEQTPEAGAPPELSDDFTAETVPSLDTDAPESEDGSGDVAAFWGDNAVDSTAESEDTGLDAAHEAPEAPYEDAAPQVDDVAPVEEQAIDPEPEPEPEPEPAPAPATAAAPPEPDPEPEPGTPEALLRTAQRAMAAGNVSDAKMFALQLAVNMARLEANQVADRIALIESDITRNREAVASGELAVHEAEERVRRLEEDVARCRQEFEEKQRRIEELRGEVAAAEGAVEDLNRQIAELEARRDAEAERLAGIQSNLNDSVGEEQRMQAELESLVEEESGSRENLDGARDHVRALQESGAAHEARLAETQTEFARREKAVEDIETTLRHVTGEPEPVAEAPANGDAAPETDDSPGDGVAGGHEETHEPQQAELLPADDGSAGGGDGEGNGAPQEHAG